MVRKVFYFTLYLLTLVKNVKCICRFPYCGLRQAQWLFCSTSILLCLNHLRYLLIPTVLKCSYFHLFLIDDLDLHKKIIFVQKMLFQSDFCFLCNYCGVQICKNHIFSDSEIMIAPRQDTKIRLPKHMATAYWVDSII